MKRLVWIRTSPPDVPGSMPAFSDLVQRAFESQPGDWQASVCDLFDPQGGRSIWKHHLWRLVHARRVLAEHPADLYHWLDGSMAAFIPSALLDRSIATVHDLIPLLQWRGELPGRPSRLATWLIRRNVRALRNCAGLSADSNATRMDLARWVRGTEDVRVMPVPLRPLPPPQPVPGLAAGGRFILHVGNNAAYKNRRGVLEVFAQLGDLRDVHLVMAGPAPDRFLRGAARRLERIHFVGPVNDAQLHDLYLRAALLLFPSLYEGYGMPVAEAMAAGCPVVCSTAAALVEVAGDAALSAPAADPGALAAACRSILNDEVLRRDLLARGKTRTAAFDVASLGRSLLKWYAQVLEKKESHG